jgi:hypothetical protein
MKRFVAVDKSENAADKVIALKVREFSKSCATPEVGSVERVAAGAA